MNDPFTAPRILLPRKEGVEYYADRWRENWFVISNSDPTASAESLSELSGYNYGVWALNDRTLQWFNIVPRDSSVQINDVDVFSDHLVLYERAESLPRIRVLDLRVGSDGFPTIEKETVVALPTVGAIEPGINLDYSSKKLRFTFSSPIRIPTVYDYDLEKKVLIPLLEKKTKDNLKEEDFVCERVSVPGHDGEEIPLTLIHSKRMEKNGLNRVMVNSYGAYGHNVEAEWRAETAALLKDGWVIALAHVRGGGEKGRPWYDAGRLLKKGNGVHDLEACLNYLVRENITKPERIAAIAASAGGVLLAALANRTGRANLGAMVLRVPFVDVLTAMQDPNLPLTQHEYDEFGNPSVAAVKNAIMNYDPYLNVKDHPYPHMLITASTMDIRVPYWGPLKFIAKLRYCRKHDPNGSLLLARIDDDRGHFGEGGRNGNIRERAYEIAFLEMALSLSQSEK